MSVGDEGAAGPYSELKSDFVKAEGTAVECSAGQAAGEESPSEIEPAAAITIFGDRIGLARHAQAAWPAAGTARKPIASRFQALIVAISRDSFTISSSENCGSSPA